MILNKEEPALSAALSQLIKKYTDSGTGGYNITAAPRELEISVKNDTVKVVSDLYCEIDKSELSRLIKDISENDKSGIDMTLFSADIDIKAKKSVENSHIAFDIKVDDWKKLISAPGCVTFLIEYGGKVALFMFKPLVTGKAENAIKNFIKSKTNCKTNVKINDIYLETKKDLRVKADLNVSISEPEFRKLTEFLSAELEKLMYKEGVTNCKLRIDVSDLSLKISAEKDSDKCSVQYLKTDLGINFI